MKIMGKVDGERWKGWERKGTRLEPQEDNYEMEFVDLGELHRTLKLGLFYIYINKTSGFRVNLAWQNHGFW
jgi:hypothetical protein